MYTLCELCDNYILSSCLLFCQEVLSKNCKMWKFWAEAVPAVLHHGNIYEAGHKTAMVLVAVRHRGIYLLFCCDRHPIAWQTKPEETWLCRTIRISIDIFVLMHCTKSSNLDLVGDVLFTWNLSHQSVLVLGVVLFAYCVGAILPAVSSLLLLLEEPNPFGKWLSKMGISNHVRSRGDFLSQRTVHGMLVLSVGEGVLDWRRRDFNHSLLDVTWYQLRGNYYSEWYLVPCQYGAASISVLAQNQLFTRISNWEWSDH